VHIYLESIASQLIDKIFARFPTIIDDINDIVSRALKEEKEITRELIENVIDSERTYIFTNDIDYMTQRTSFIPTSKDGKTDPKVSVDPEKLFIDEMRARIDAYFAIVLRNIRDTVPKILGNFLVKAVQEKMQYTLYNEINKNDQLMNLVGEPPHITAERETLNKVLGVLRKARIVLTKDPDFTPIFKDSAPTQLKATTQTTSTSDPRIEKPRPQYDEREDRKPVQTDSSNYSQSSRVTTNPSSTTTSTPVNNPIQKANPPIDPTLNNPFKPGQPTPFVKPNPVFTPNTTEPNKKPGAGAGAGLFG